MKVSCIMPTAGRVEMVERAVSQFVAQDYADKELIIVSEQDDAEALKKMLPAADNIWQIAMADRVTIGAKRNMAATFSAADVIVHMDDDDTYAPDWITKSVAALVGGDGNLTGLAQAYFDDVVYDARYLYTYPKGAQPYVLEATMCYYRSYWQQHPFADTSSGEGIGFCATGIVRPHGYIDGFAARLHGGNTCSYKSLCGREFRLM